MNTPNTTELKCALPGPELSEAALIVANSIPGVIFSYRDGEPVTLTVVARLDMEDFVRCELERCLELLFGVRVYLLI